ncbi:MAG TPA: hypothetical protein VER96_36550 [Polyangiaceae bacterium]|nr:hypothetical protein [Polyangiaceae bacterium]HYQ42785.1 hypothetical protein [Polyangiaceae bacterium]
MNCRLLFGAALAVFTGAALAACGGSSSETPPPLQPDPAGFRYAPTFSRPVVEESDAGDAPGAPVETTTPKAAPRAPGQ